MSGWIEAARLVVPAEEEYAYRLLLSEYLRRDVIRRAVGGLGLPEGSRGLDAGCGIGGPATLLAGAVGGRGHVTAVDIDGGMLSHAADIAKRCGLSGRVTFSKGDIENLPFDDGEFDWLVSIDCFGYPSLEDPHGSLAGLGRVVRPGGTVALMGWTSQQVLPGYPSLEARLNTGSSLVLAGTARGSPETSFARAPQWFSKAGMHDLTCRTYAGDVAAPLESDERQAMLSLFDMLWGNAEPHVSAADRSELQRLCSAESPDCILGLPGYHAFFTYTVATGEVGE